MIDSQSFEKLPTHLLKYRGGKVKLFAEFPRNLPEPVPEFGAKVRRDRGEHEDGRRQTPLELRVVPLDVRVGLGDLLEEAVHGVRDLAEVPRRLVSVCGRLKIQFLVMFGLAFFPNS